MLCNIAGMRLLDYLTENDLTQAAFAKQIGRDRSTVNRVANGQVDPDGETVRAIHRATGGQVTADDLFGLSSPDETAAEATA